MYCRANDLRCKDVINVRNGCRLGCVGDFEVDITNARISSLIIYGRYRFFGLFGRERDRIIRWCDIKVIGDDTILVNIDAGPDRNRRR